MPAVDAMCAEFQRLLNAAGWNMSRAARELAIAPSIVSRYCAGTVKPSLTVLRLFAGLIGEAVHLPGESPGPVEWRRGPRFLERWESDLLAVMRRLDAPRRKPVARGIEMIVDGLVRHPMAKAPPADGLELNDEALAPGAGAAALSALDIPCPAPRPLTDPPSGQTVEPGGADPVAPDDGLSHGVADQGGAQRRRRRRAGG